LNVGVISASSLANAFQNAQNIAKLSSGEAVMFTWGSTTRGRRTYLGVADDSPGNVDDDFLVLTPRKNFDSGALNVGDFFI
jgi:hypothetical protein